MIYKFFLFILLSSCSILSVQGEGRKAHFSREEMIHILESQDYVLISGGRNLSDPQDALRSEEEISRREKKLLQLLQEKNLKFQEMIGHYGVKEKSYFILSNKKQEDAFLYLGQIMKQESIILGSQNKQKLVYVTGKKKGMAHYGHQYREVSLQETDFYSEIKLNDGSLFRFSLFFNFDELCPHTPKEFEGCQKITP